MGPPGPCRPQMGPLLAPWYLLSGWRFRDFARSLDTVLGVLSDIETTPATCSIEYPPKKHPKLLSGQNLFFHNIPDSKVHGTNMGPIWGRQDPGGPHSGPMKFAVWDPCQLLNGFEILHRAGQSYRSALCKVTKRFHKSAIGYGQRRIHFRKFELCFTRRYKKEYTRTNKNIKRHVVKPRPMTRNKLMVAQVMHRKCQRIRRAIKKHVHFNPIIHYRQKYRIFGKRNGNTRIWHFHLLDMAWHQPKTSIVTLMQLSLVVLWARNFNLHCPKLKAHSWIYKNLSFVDTSTEIPRNF